MSSSDPQPPVTGDDVWTEHATLIRRLYISERKTLKQVKEILENQHGFPAFPLSTYETKLRDKLRLRKKLKKADWPAVYQHVRDRGSKETGIYVNGMRIPWKKAWKEIRRSGYRSATDNQLCQLPAGVVVRTPSPTRRASPLLSPSSPSAMSPLPIPTEDQLEHTSVALQDSGKEIDMTRGA
ncbi:hypothetical protein F5Y12DRAFT_738004 [Xylaria sp. FL1777]|nr:hypothetical protein F5Y12DRAFT_738004 [Xylaria sp. FL1777]